MGDLLLAALVEGFPKYTQGVNGANSTSGDHTTVTVHLPAHPFVTGQEVTVYDNHTSLSPYNAKVFDFVTG